MRTCIFWVASLLFLVGGSSPASAQGPRSMSFQGSLTDALDAPLNGPYPITLKLYPAATGGTQFWSRTYPGVSVSEGVFDLVLEKGSPAFKDFTLIDSLWIEVSVASNTLTPRTQLRASPFAMGLSLPISAEAEVGGGDQAALQVTNTATSGANYAVLGRSSSVSGIGVFGQTTATTGVTYGLFGETMSSSGIGVAGSASKTSGQSFGVLGQSNSPSGVGVRGLAADPAGSNFGVVGQTNSAFGVGVFGEATNPMGGGEAIGVSGSTHSSLGKGVSGISYSSLGSSTGVFGETMSPTGWAGYFTGGQGGFFRGAANDGPDLILGGHTDFDDEGMIYSDPRLPSSDIWFRSNDAVVIQLDMNGDGEDADFEIKNKDGALVFNVDESGTVDIADSLTVGGSISVGGVIVHSSDRNRKDGIVPVDVADILDEVARLPISQWRYKGQSAPHVGPMAQDFYASFGLGGTDKGIATVDADGVALAAIQGLYLLTLEQGRLLAAKQSEIERLRRIVEGGQ